MKRYVSHHRSLGYGDENGVYYFLGNIFPHINHAFGLYEEIGGTFVALSRDVYELCVKRDVSVVMLDDRPDLNLQFATEEAQRTITFLNSRAKVVIFYEIFEISKDITAKQVMLTHGNSFKNYYIGWRQELLPYFSLIAGLGPDWERRTLLAGAKPDQILRVGLARGDEIIKDAGRVHHRRKIARMLGLDPRKQIITYMPTWWGPTSVNDIGRSIALNMPEQYSFIFRPHPDTPKEVIESYERIINTEKLNSVYVPDGRYADIDLLKIYAASSLFIGDMSSVVLDALLTDKPVLFALGKEMLDKQDMKALDPIKRLLTTATITSDDIPNLGDILSHSLSTSLSTKVTRELKGEIYYGLNGDSLQKTADAIRSLVTQAS